MIGPDLIQETEEKVKIIREKLKVATDKQKSYVICVLVGYAGINNIYNLILPIAVAWLLQYSGSKVKHRDGFSSHK